jgi:hypothetical protein
MVKVKVNGPETEYHQMSFYSKLACALESRGIIMMNLLHCTETLSGKNTLHDTVGICYQNIVLVQQEVPPELESSIGEEDIPLKF